MIKSTRNIVFYFILFILFFCLFLLYARFIGTKGLFVKEYSINVNIPDSFNGLKIVHISDIHYDRTFKEKDLKKLVERVNLINPDIIVITGDIFDKEIFNNDDNKDILTNYLKQMNAKIGKYAISGNHDLFHDEFDDVLESSNFVNLNNTYDLIYYKGYEPIIIAGLSSYFDDQDINEKLNEYHSFILENDISYKILLLHEPDVIDSIEDNFDLILAGHSHNGEVKLPLIGSLFLPDGSKKYYKEYYEINGSKLFISSGLGTNNIPFRFLNHPSINFYRLNIA